jgi:hypothetical protein
MGLFWVFSGGLGGFFSCDWVAVLVSEAGFVVADSF